jgi:outer membrane receptor for ferrienterochelin and colicins
MEEDGSPRQPECGAPSPRRGSIRLRSLLPVGLFAAVSCAFTVHSAEPELDLAKLKSLSIEQIMQIEIPTVHGASKYDQKITRAPSSVTIITREEIQAYGHRTLAEILRSVSGLYVTNDRNYSNIGIRGFARPGDFNTRVLLLVDGHRMNDNLYNSALIGTEAIVDVDLIERVEVIRGPSSSIYGNSAFFGVINVITRAGGSINGAEASVEAGTFGGGKARLTYGRKFDNGMELLLSGSFFDTDGHDRLYFREFDSPRTNHGIAENSDSEYSRSFFGRLSYKDLTLTTAYLLRDKHVPTASFGTIFNDGREKTVDERIFAELKYQHTFRDDLQFMSRVYYDYYGYRADYPYNFAGPGSPPFPVVTHDDNYGDGAGLEVQLTKKIADKHTLVLGAEYSQDLNLYQSNYTNDPLTYNSLSNQSLSMLGIYAQGEFALTEQLLLNVGLRYDEQSYFGGSLNPRAGLIFSPSDKSTVKLLYGQAYRAPNAYEMFQDSPGYIEPNLDLRPETIQTFELAYERQLSREHRFRVSGYRYLVDDLISQEVNPATGLKHFINVQSATANGIELELESKYAGGLRTRVSCALQETEDGDTGGELNNSPRFMAKAGVISPPFFNDKVTAGIELQYTGGLNTIDGNSTPGFLITNLTLFDRKVTENLDLSATVYNVFDRSYAYPGSTGHVQDTIPQDGRSFVVKLNYRF